jgi:acyl-coenzyme A synthetase/AMP-(fatty) acid ligase
LFAIIERSLVLYPDGVDLISMPMHSLGGIQCFLVNLALQRCLVLPQNNELIAFCKAARDTQPRTILGFPSYAAALLDGRDTKELRETVEVIHTGGEKLTAATRAALEDGLGCRVYPAYGMAEFGAISVNRETSPERLEALGDLLPGVNIRLDPVFGTKQTDMGELVVSGASLMLGYRHADGQFDPAGQWLKTGDILRRDSAGILWHMGRKSDFVAHEDTSVSLAEIERFLAADPTLKASAAVAKPTRGVAVFIKLSPHAAQDEVRANIFGRIEKQWPGLITKNDVHTFEELPLNAAGKVDRTYLSSVAADNLVSAT